LFVVREAQTRDGDPTACTDQKVPRPFVRTFRANYRWNARRRTFVTTASDLARLYKEIKRPNSP
jgi:hypothetical protein